jgi:GT2 family glycosyltransferase
MNSTINRIAVILTCFNRKDKTVRCIEYLYKSRNSCSKKIELDVFLTDDGSTDGSALTIKEKFPNVNIFFGNGNLFWAGGMRNSWKEALKCNNYQAYLLLNDDSFMEINCLDELIKCHEYSIENHGTGGIYIGSLKDPQTEQFTYGGRIIKNKWTISTQIIIPNGTIQNCQLGNANIMLVHEMVIKKISIFSDRYIHGKADYDYTLRASNKKLPVLVCSSYCGYCTIDHKIIDLSKMTFRERFHHLVTPLGIEISGYMYFMWKFFPWRVPFVFVSLCLKTVFPSISNFIDRIMRR